MKINRIESRDNPKFKIWFSLLNRQGIEEHQHYLLFGRKVVEEALKTEYGKSLLISEDHGVKVNPPNHVKLFILKDQLFSKIDIFNTQSPILVCDWQSFPNWNIAEPPIGIEILCTLRNPSNLGALIRTSAAFQVSKFIILKEAAHPYLPRTVRASSGGHFYNNFYHGPSLKDLQGDFLALDPKGESIYQYKWPQNVRILMGEEGQGFKYLKVKHSISIPMNPKIESLNATVAASIALFHYRMQFPDFINRNEISGLCRQLQ